jgi:hypothetical protein
LLPSPVEKGVMDTGGVRRGVRHLAPSPPDFSKKIKSKKKTRSPGKN